MERTIPTVQAAKISRPEKAKRVAAGRIASFAIDMIVLRISWAGAISMPISARSRTTPTAVMAVPKAKRRIGPGPAARTPRSGEMSGLISAKRTASAAETPPATSSPERMSDGSRPRWRGRSRMRTDPMPIRPTLLNSIMAETAAPAIPSDLGGKRRAAIHQKTNPSPEVATIVPNREPARGMSAPLARYARTKRLTVFPPPTRRSPRRCDRASSHSRPRDRAPRSRPPA